MFDYNTFKLHDKIHLNVFLFLIIILIYHFQSSITKLESDLTDSNRIIASTFDGAVHLFDYRKKGMDVKKFQAGSTIHDFVQTVSNEIICGCEDGVIRLFDLKI